MTSPPAVRRRRRRWPLVLLVVVVVLVGLAVAADRVVAAYAQKLVGQRLGEQAGFGSSPTVHVDGFPFLTQAIGGDYGHVTVNGSGLTLGNFHDVGFSADLHGVHVPLSSVVHQQVDQVPIDQATGRIVIPYAEFAKQTGISGLTITESGGTITVSAPVPIDVAFLHQTLDVVADGRVAAVGGGLQLTVDHVRVAGISLPDVAVNAISDVLNSQVSLPALPYGLTLQRVDAADDGLHVVVGGQNLTVSTR